MPAERRYGMDHEHYDWSPLSTRGILRWPDNARLALSVVVTLEHMEWLPPEGSYQPANLAGGSAARPFPDYARISHREYGHRVGIYRVLDVLERHGAYAPPSRWTLSPPPTTRTWCGTVSTGAARSSATASRSAG